MKFATGLAIPLVLILAGLLLLIGCFPVPATQQLQPSLAPRPELGISTGPDKFIQIGVTHIDDAFIELNQRIYTCNFGTTGVIAPWEGKWQRLATFGNRFPGQMLRHWLVSDDNREFRVRFSVRKSTLVYPLCFQMMPDTDSYDLVLDVDENGVVTAARTLEEATFRGPMPVARWFEIFDEPTRRKLHDAGVFPSDATLRALAAIDSPHPATYPTTQWEG